MEEHVFHVDHFAQGCTKFTFSEAGGVCEKIRVLAKIRKISLDLWFYKGVFNSFFGVI